MHSVIKIPIHKPGTTKRAPPIWFVSISGLYLCYLWLKRFEWIDSGKLLSVHSVVKIPFLKRSRRSAPLQIFDLRPPTSASPHIRLVSVLSVQSVVKPVRKDRLLGTLLHAFRVIRGHIFTLRCPPSVICVHLRNLRIHLHPHFSTAVKRIVSNLR